MSASIITLGTVVKAFFLFLGLPKNLGEEGPFEVWLAKDGFDRGVLNDVRKQPLLKELEKLKERFRFDLLDSSRMVDDKGNHITPLKTTELISAAMIRIEKLRLVINHEISIVKNHHKPTGVNYIVARTYWIDSRGKKFRKFAKNLGAEEKVMVKGKVTKERMKQLELEIDTMMLNQYRMEYS
jgi:hypothetical protein